MLNNYENFDFSIMKKCNNCKQVNLKRTSFNTVFGPIVLSPKRPTQATVTNLDNFVHFSFEYIFLKLECLHLTIAQSSPNFAGN